MSNTEDQKPLLHITDIVFWHNDSNSTVVVVDRENAGRNIELKAGVYKEWSIFVPWAYKKEDISTKSIVITTKKAPDFFVFQGKKGFTDKGDDLVQVRHGLEGEPLTLTKDSVNGRRILKIRADGTIDILPTE